MFASAYFPGRYFPKSYFPDSIGSTDPEPVPADVSTGGWFGPRPRKRKKPIELPVQIPEPVKEIIQDVAARSVRNDIARSERETVRDLEIALRIRLRTREVLFRQIYLDALKDWRVELKRRADALIAEEVEIATVIARML